ncbi:MAG: hypothetical protein HQL72_10165 [Magnetococcales bacterium]|nr:hypothetical protein [Magnetococcales bacterium]
MSNCSGESGRERGTVCIKDGTLQHKSVCKQGWRGVMCRGCYLAGGNSGQIIDKLWPNLSKLFT